MDFLVLLSRTLNVLAGGSPRERFCSRAYRRRWTTYPLIDRLMLRLWPDDTEHCRRCHLSEYLARRQERTRCR